MDEVLLARPVAVVHRADLRQRHVALVGKQNKVLREIIKQLIGAEPSGRPVMTRIFSMPVQ